MKIYTLEHNDAYSLVNVHPKSACKGRPCAIHNRSNHHMRSWTQIWRSDRGIIERIDPFLGIGHPDPDSPWDKDSYEWIHGCAFAPTGLGLCAPFKIDGYDAAWIDKDLAKDVAGYLWQWDDDWIPFDGEHPKYDWVFNE